MTTIFRKLAVGGLALWLAHPLCSLAANPAPNIVLAVAETASPVAPGETVSYAITASNTGTATAGTIVLSASVPQYTTVPQALASGWSCTGAWPCAPGEDLYVDVALGIGQIAVRQFSAQLVTTSKPADGTVTSTTVSTSVVAGPTVVEQTVVRSKTGLNVSISCPPGAVAPLSFVNCDLNYSNSGTSLITANLVYSFPAALSVQSVTGNGAVGAGTVAWGGIALAAHGVGHQTVGLQVPAGASAGAEFPHNVMLSDSAGVALAATAGTVSFVAASPLQIGVTATPSPVQAGDVVSYAITVSNTGAATTGSYYLYATVPNYTTVAQSEAIDWYCSGTWPCQPGEQLYIALDLTAGWNETVQFAATVNDGATAPPLGSLLTTSITDAFGGAAVGSATVASIDPILVMSAPEQVAAGGTYTYNLTYGNSGKAKHDTVLTMALPLGTTLVSASGSATVANGIVTWTQDAFAAGDVVSQQLTVTAPTSAIAGALVAASAAVLDAESLATYSQASADTVIGGADPLQIGVTVTPSPVQAGDVATYAITVSNTSAATTGSYYLYATVPSYTTVAQSEAINWYCSGTWPCQPGDLLYTALDLAAGRHQTVQFAATVSAGATAPPLGTLLTTTLSDAFGGAAVGWTSVTNLGPTLTLSAPDQVPAGGTYTYTLSYGNNGSAKHNTVLSMAVPTGTTLVSASKGAKIVEGGVTTVTWTKNTFTPGEVVSHQLTVTAPTGSAAGSLVSASAAVLDTASLLTYSQASAETFVGGTDPLQIGVNVTPSAVQPGSVATYSISVSNPSATTTGSYYVYATVPSYTTVAQSDAINWYCSGTWPCQPGDQLYIALDLAAGRNQTVQFAATVNAGATAPPLGSLLTTNLSDPFGGAATGSTLVGNLGPILVMSAPEQAPVGGTYVYNLTYGNSGSATPNTVLTMAVPQGTTLVSASGDAQIVKGKVTVVNWTQDALAPGEVVSQQLTVRGPKSSAEGSLVSGSAAVLDATSLLSYSQASADTFIGGTDPLQIGVNVAPSAVQPGSIATYTITVSNTSAATTGSYYVYASVPSYTTVAQSDAINWYCSGTWPCQPGNQLYTALDLAAGRNQTVQFAVTVNEGATAPPLGSLLTTHIVDPFGGAAMGSAQVANLGPTLVMSAPQQVTEGSTYAYTLTYGNSGSATPDTVLTMTVPLGTTLVSASGGATVSGSNVTWTQGALARGQVVSQELTVTAPTSAAAGSLVTGTATVLDATSLLTYSQGSADTFIGGTDPLQLGVTVAPSAAQPGSVATYVITVTNTSAATTGSYYVYAAVPDFTSVAQTQATGWYCSGAWPCQPGEQLYTALDLTAGQGANVQFTATVNAGATAPSVGTLITSGVTDPLGGAVQSAVPVN